MILMNLKSINYTYGFVIMLDGELETSITKLVLGCYYCQDFQTVVSSSPLNSNHLKCVDHDLGIFEVKRLLITHKMLNSWGSLVNQGH